MIPKLFRPRSLPTSLSQTFSNLLLWRLFLPLLILSLASITAISIFAFQLYQAELLSYNQSVVYAVETYINSASNVIDALTLRGETATTQEMHTLFKAFNETYDAFDAFYLLDENGEIITFAPDDQSFLGLDMSRHPFYQPANILPDVVISSPFISIRTGQPTVYLAQDIERGQMVVAELNLSALQHAINSKNATLRDTIVFVVDSYGNLLAHPDRQKVLQQDRWKDINIIESRPAQSSVIIYLHQGDQGSQHNIHHYDLLTASDIRSTGWYVVSLTPLNQFIGPYALLAVVLTILSAGLLVIVVRSFLRRFQWYVADPLKQLSSITHTIAQGNYANLPISEPIHRILATFEELEALKSDFYEMNQALKRREDELRQAKEDLQRFNSQLETRVTERTTQLEAATREMEAFSYSVSHDLRAPLRHINGYTNILKESYANRLDARGNELLEHVHHASLRMAALIDSLLMLSRISRSEMRYENVNLSTIASEIAVELQSSQTDRQVHWEIQPDLTVQADTSLMYIVMNNLLSNAWKFTSYHDEAHIQIGSVNKEGIATYFVRDDGAGFDMAYVNKLFGAFQRLHSEDEFEGTGVGLALVQRIITRHKGRIWAEAAPEEGAVFYFTLGG
jgi:signal transduction histidine kinase